MQSLICGMLAVLVACAVPPKRYTAKDHEQAAAHYDATADWIQTQCWEARKGQVSIHDENPCRNADDIQALNENRRAADEQRAEAAQLREMQARGEPLPVQKPDWLPGKPAPEKAQLLP